MRGVVRVGRSVPAVELLRGVRVELERASDSLPDSAVAETDGAGFSFGFTHTYTRSTTVLRG